MDIESNELNEELKFENPISIIEVVQTTFKRMKNEMRKLIIGNDQLIEFTIIGLFTEGHILFEGVPGVAKTLISKIIARTIGVKFQRIQFTPDLMPSDLIGNTVFNMQESNFVFKKGPVFANLVLIDEVNRAPAKTQAAMLEVMEEKQVTVDGKTYLMSSPFFVVATQNPIEHEGTYRLPDAQLDRFLLKLKVTHPNLQEEIAILDRFKDSFNVRQAEDDVNQVVSPEDIKQCREAIESVTIKPDLLAYIARIVHETRNHGEIYLGASPRASLALMKTSKGLAALRGRDFVTPDDIQAMCIPVLNHRIVLTPEKEMAGGTAEQVIKGIIKEIEVPR